MAFKKQSRYYKSSRRPPTLFARRSNTNRWSTALNSSSKLLHGWVYHSVGSRFTQAFVEVVFSIMYRCYALVLVFSSCVMPASSVENSLLRRQRAVTYPVVGHGLRNWCIL